MSYANFPLDLTSKDQWMVYKEGSKRPLDPETMTQGTWEDPLNWGSFLSAWMAVFSGRAAGLGFVNTTDTGFAFLDLDNKPSHPANEQQLKYHAQLLEMTRGTYTEYSLSTTEEYQGYHIIVKCGVDLPNCNREHIEFRQYGFTALTGWTVTEEEMPILNGIDRNLELMHSFLTKNEHVKPVALSEPETRSDDELWSVLENSANNEKLFHPKQGGDSQTDYDIACWITKLTRNKEQAIRLFLRTPYAQGKKSDGKVLAESEYHVNRVIDRALNETQVPAIDISKLMKPKPQPVVTPVPAMPLVIPPMSLIEEIVQHGLRIAHKPSEHTALAGALALMGAICGRTYTTPTNGGTALFLFLIAATGAGKELSKQIVKELLFEMQKAGVMTATDMAGFRLISGPGIHSMLHEQESRSTVLLENEGVAKLSMIAKRATPLHEELLQSILSLYSDNKPGGMLQRTGHATKEKKLGTVEFPAVSMLFEGVPEEFDKTLSEEMISTGLLARFLVIEKIGSTIRNFDADENHTPNASLGNKLFALINYSLQMQALKQTHRVGWTDEAKALLQGFATRTDKEMEARTNKGTARLWERAYENALRVATLVAVSYDMEHPCITAPMADWAINFVLHSLWSVEKRFDAGTVGEGDASQLARVREIIEKYSTSAYDEIKNQYVKAAAHAKGMISYSYLQNKTQSVAVFSKDRLGATNALKRVIETLISAGELIRIDTKTQGAMNIGGALHYGIMA